MSLGQTKAAFKVGQKLRYKGNRISSDIRGKEEIPSFFKNMVVTIIEVKKPVKGLGFIKNDEEGEPIIDHDSNGYNIWQNENGVQKLLWPETKDQWEVI